MNPFNTDNEQTNDEQTNISTEEENESPSSNDDGRVTPPTIPHTAETTGCGFTSLQEYLRSIPESRATFMLPPSPILGLRTPGAGERRTRSMKEIIDAALDIVNEPLDGHRPFSHSSYHGLLPRQ